MPDYSADLGASVPPPPRPIEYRGVDTGGWWVSILLGLALFGVGVWMLSNLYDSVVVLALLVGVSLIVGGVVEIVALGGNDVGGPVAWLGGGLVVAAGLVVLAWPDITLTALAVLAGTVSVVVGLVHIALAVASRGRGSDWPIELGLGFVGVVVGLVVMIWPSATLLVLGLVLGIRAVLTGLMAVAMGWRLHQIAG